jgi:hypothetical protein
MTTRPTRWLARKLGRRGASLLFLGAAFALIGVKGLFAPSLDDGRFVLYTYLPPVVRALLWIVPGVLAILAASKPVSRDGFGFMALTVPATVLTFSYVWSSVAFLLGVTDYAFGWTNALTWALILVFIFIVAGWPEPERERLWRGRHKARGRQ